MPLIDLDAFHPLFYRERTPRNGSQETLLLAWDAIELVHSDGFERLIEQTASLDKYATALAQVGLAGVVPVITRVQEVIADAPRDNDDAYWQFLRAQFEPLKKLAEEFWEKSANSDDVLLQFVNDHEPEFAEYLPRPAAGA